MGTRCLGLALIAWAAALLAAPVTTTTRPTWVYNVATTHWYCLTPGAASRADAIMQATAWGGYLGTITDAAENQVVGDNLLVGETKAAWLGLREVAAEGNWQWDTGETFAYSNWNGGEPNGFDSLQYGEIYPPAAAGQSPKWNDTHATDTGKKGLVERAATPVGECALPAFSLASGSYTAPQTLVVTCATAGATLRYTADGSAPTRLSPIVPAGGIVLSGTQIISVYASAAGLTDSDAVRGSYVVRKAPPTIRPDDGQHAGDIVSVNTTTASVG